MSIFVTDGYRIIKQLIDRQTITNLDRAIAKHLTIDSSYGIRNLHHKTPFVNRLANSPIIIDRPSKCTNHKQFRLIKAIYFNKNKQYNWSVPWHQDKTIAVKNKVTLPGYKNWTIKQGVPHVQPPLEVLNKITAVRIALDDSNKDNGGLKIIPGTHALGVLTQTEIDRLTQQTALSFSLKAGDALIMHPLTLHASNRSTCDRSRRIIHLEYSSGDLPSLAWY